MPAQATHALLVLLAVKLASSGPPVEVIAVAMPAFRIFPLPLTVAAPVGGYLLDHFNTGYTTTWIEPCHAGPGSSCNGYVVLFVLSGLYFAFASLAVFCTSDKIK